MKYQNRALVIGKLFFLILVYGFIVHKLRAKIGGFAWEGLSAQILYSPLFFFLIGLWVINILLESLKWKELMRYKVEMDFRASIRSVLQGFAFGIFTPYRLGEWIGRVIGFEKHKKTGMLLAMAGSIMQTFVIGLVGGILVILMLQGSIRLNVKFYFVVISVAVLLVAIILGIRHAKSKWQPFLRKIKSVVSTYPALWYAKTFGFTILRYCMFSIQLGLLLWYFTDIPTNELFITIPVYFFVITFLPSFSFVELGIRISSGLLLFAPQNEWALEVTTAILVLWMLNVVFSAMIGSVLVVRLNTFSIPKFNPRALWKYYIKT